jgi:hypothetical protein
MLISAEIRWFWKDTKLSDLQRWFCESDAHSFAAGGGKPRTDQYLRDPQQVELGIKHRGEATGVEIKGLVMLTPETITFGHLCGSTEIWGKWNTTTLKIDSLSVVTVRKRRWLRKFDTVSEVPVEIALDANEQPIKERRLPQEGCNVELTRLDFPHLDEWWTLGFEAFGTFERVRHSLRSAAQTIITRRPPEPPDAILASYPKWLAECIDANAKL